MGPLEVSWSQACPKQGQLQSYSRLWSCIRLQRVITKGAAVLHGWRFLSPSGQSTTALMMKKMCPSPNQNVSCCNLWLSPPPSSAYLFRFSVTSHRAAQPTPERRTLLSELSGTKLLHAELPRLSCFAPTAPRLSSDTATCPALQTRVWGDRVSLEVQPEEHTQHKCILPWEGRTCPSFYPNHV